MKKHLMVLMLVLVMPAVSLAGSYIESVETVSAQVEAGRTAGQLSFRVTEPGHMEVLVCDLDGYVVRHLFSGKVSSGSRSVSWDGLDDDGKAVANGAYLPVLRFTSVLGASEVYDPTSFGWGAKLEVKDISFQDGSVSYSLPRAALCLLRAGELPGGPCYKTILQWQPRSAGNHSEAWDGKDAGGVQQVSGLTGLKLVLDAMALPKGSFLVTGSDARMQRRPSGSEQVPIYPPMGKDIFIHSLHPRWLCRDPELQVRIVSGLGLFRRIKSGKLVFSVTAKHDRDAYNMEREGCEVYGFVDGRFMGEIKTSVLPVTYGLDCARMEPGRHVITINLRSIEDHVGSWSCVVTK